MADVRKEKEATIIEISGRTVSFGEYVYQTINVTGFAGGKLPRHLLRRLAVISLLVGLAAYISELRSLGTPLMLIAIAIGLYEFLMPQHGFMLLLNSGKIQLFTTTNKKFVLNTVKTLKEAIENGFREGSYIVNIASSTVQVGEGNSQVIHSHDDGNMRDVLSMDTRSDNIAE